MLIRGLAETRSKAQGLILSGRVLLAGRVTTKCGAAVRPGEEIALGPAPRPFVSRGGENILGAAHLPQHTPQQYGYTITEQQSFIQVMGDENSSHPGLRKDGMQVLKQMSAGGGV